MNNMGSTMQTSWHVGQCIYCGTSEGKLSDEHIIPYGLNGDFVLRKASCAACATITSRFERDVLRNLFPAARAALGYKTRRKHPETFPAKIRRDGKEG
jgi:hypothetical protein